MMTALHDDCTMPGEDALQASQPSHFDCSIPVAKDQQRWYHFDRAQSVLQVDEVVVAFCDTLEQCSSSHCGRWAVPETLLLGA